MGRQQRLRRKPTSTGHLLGAGHRSQLAKVPQQPWNAGGTPKSTDTDPEATERGWRHTEVRERQDSGRTPASKGILVLASLGG